MKINLTLGDRVILEHLILNTPGLNREEARIVKSLDIKLSLDEVISVARKDFLTKSTDYDLDDHEVNWIADQINAAFKAQRVPSLLAAPALSLEEKVRAIGDEREA